LSIFPQKTLLIISSIHLYNISIISNLCKEKSLPVNPIAFFTENLKKDSKESFQTPSSHKNLAQQDPGDKEITKKPQSVSVSERPFLLQAVRNDLTEEEADSRHENEEGNSRISSENDPVAGLKNCRKQKRRSQSRRPRKQEVGREFKSDQVFQKNEDRIGKEKKFVEGKEAVGIREYQDGEAENSAYYNAPDEEETCKQKDCFQKNFLDQFSVFFDCGSPRI